MALNFSRRPAHLAFIPLLFLAAPYVYAAGMALPAPQGYVEAGANHHVLTDGYDNWNGIYAKGVWQNHSHQVWNWEVLRQSEFNDEGTYATGGLTHTFNDDWYASASVGVGSGALFFPKHRIDLAINRKLLPPRNLVVTLGAGYITARDIHRDRTVLLGAAYYFDTPWIIEGGMRVNHSTPGSINARSYYAAVTQGREKERYLTLRYETGREAYQLIDEFSTLVDFHSDIVSLTWREWLKRNWGMNVVIEHYSNPFYDRTGLTLGVFREF